MDKRMIDVIKKGIKYYSWVVTRDCFLIKDPLSLLITHIIFSNLFNIYTLSGCTARHAFLYAFFTSA